MSDVQPDLLAAIGAALGLPGPYSETSGERENAISLGTMFSPPIEHHREVLGGAAANGRVAWVELRSAPPINGYVPVEIDVRFAWDGGLRHVIEPYTYNPYFGVRVRFARWYGERFVLVYREKHKMLLSHFDPPYDAQEYVQIGDSVIVDGDRVFYLDRREPLLRGHALPGITEIAPLAIPPSEEGHLLWLERPGVARLAVLQPRGDRTWDAELERAREAAIAIELPP